LINEVAMDHASGGWGIVRASWVDHPEVGPDELAMLSLLSLYANRDGSCWPSQSTLADRLKRSRSWVIRVLNRLEKLGLVARSQRQATRGRRATCLYTLAGHAEAVIGSPSARGSSLSVESPGALDDKTGDRVSAHRVAEAAQEHRNPANAGLSSRDREVGKGESETRTEDGGRAGRWATRTVPPEDWSPSPADWAFAAEHSPGVNVDSFARLFVTSCHAHGYRYADHSAAFRAWLLNRWERPNADRNEQPQRRRHVTPLSRGRDGFAGDHRRAGASAGLRCPDARSAANRDTARAALALLAD
jgi:DNA-binding MarR family transcriptional regulator